MKKTSNLVNLAFSGLRQFGTAATVTPVACETGQLVSDIHGFLQDGPQLESSVEDKLHKMSTYYFDGKGKAVRTNLAVAMADAVNANLFKEGVPIKGLNLLFHNQRQIAMITEMYHTASLVHDDVLDRAMQRRSKTAINVLWGQKSSVMSGDYVVSMANKMLAMSRDEDVNVTMFQSLHDLVVGELQQMAKPKTNGSERFQRYIEKSFNKTASLMSNSCKAVSQLACNHVKKAIREDKAMALAFLLEGHEDKVKRLPDQSYEFGKNLGIAFQLYDDWLDFAATTEQLGKVAAADLKLGLATGPVLFAADKYPELNDMIKRRFSQEGDVEYTYRKVLESDGLEDTKRLACEYGRLALRSIEDWNDCLAKKQITSLVDMVTTRMN